MEKSWTAEVADEKENTFQDTHSKDLGDGNAPPDAPSDAESDAASMDDHVSGDASDDDASSSGKGKGKGKGKGRSKATSGSGGRVGVRGSVEQEQALEALIFYIMSLQVVL